MIHGLPEFQKACDRHGLKPLLGCEFYLVDSVERVRAEKDQKRYHQVAYAMDDAGLASLQRLASRAATADFYHKPLVDWASLEGHADGLVVTSSCLQGAIPQAILAGDVAEANRLVRWYRRVFGDRFYLEVHDHGIPDEAEVRRVTRLLADHYRIPVVAANDCHYPTRDDYEVQKAAVCIGMREQLATGGKYAHENLHMASEEGGNPLGGKGCPFPSREKAGAEVNRAPLAPCRGARKLRGPAPSR